LASALSLGRVSGGNIENLPNSIFFYPNLAKDKISVSFDYKGAETEFTYKIYSLSGQMLLSGTLREPQFPIGVQDLASGYYTIQFWGGVKVFIGKFVKE